jgi:hypothetical protein
MRRKPGSKALAILFHFGREAQSASLSVPAGRWTLALNSAAPRWLGADNTMPGNFVTESSPLALELQPRSFLILEHAGRLPK